MKIFKEDIYFTEKEMVDFLLKRGFEVRKESVTFPYSTEKYDCLAVFYKGNEYLKPSNPSYGGWVQRVFEMEIQNKIKEILLK